MRQADLSPTIATKREHHTSRAWGGQAQTWLRDGLHKETPAGGLQKHGLFLHFPDVYTWQSIGRSGEKQSKAPIIQKREAKLLRKASFFFSFVSFICLRISSVGFHLLRAAGTYENIINSNLLSSRCLFQYHFFSYPPSLPPSPPQLILHRLKNRLRACRVHGPHRQPVPLPPSLPPSSSSYFQTNQRPYSQLFPLREERARLEATS